MKQTSVKQVVLENNGNLTMVIGMEIAEGGEIQFTNPLFRVVPPDGDLVINMDEIDTYLVANGYPAMTEEQRQVIMDVDAAARASAEIEANRAKAPPTTTPTPPETPEGVPEQPPPTVN